MSMYIEVVKWVSLSLTSQPLAAPGIPLLLQYTPGYNDRLGGIYTQINHFRRGIASCIYKPYQMSKLPSYPSFPPGFPPTFTYYSSQSTASAPDAMVAYLVTLVATGTLHLVDPSPSAGNCDFPF